MTHRILELVGTMMGRKQGNLTTKPAIQRGLAIDHLPLTDMVDRNGNVEKKDLRSLE